MPPKVYVESSVISAYFEARTDVVSVAQRYWSRVWWDQVRPEYDVVISKAVTDELSNPNYRYSHDTLALVVDIPLVTSANEVRDIVDVYIARRLMPHDPLGDALHLALASYHKCDYLLTWNCKPYTPQLWMRIERIDGILFVIPFFRGRFNDTTRFRHKMTGWVCQYPLQFEFYNLFFNNRVDSG